MTTKQVIQSKNSETFRELVISQFDRTPSWKMYGEGSASLRAYSHINGEWLQLNLQENSFVGNNDRGTTRATMFTLNRDSAIALRDMLNEVFK